jgi:molybdenum cofactor sulfurtransferase
MAEAEGPGGCMPEMANTNGIPTAMEDYDRYIEQMRIEQYPMLKDALYLDHAGTTLYSKKLMERFQSDMMANLFGNPHSASISSQRSTSTIEDVRLQLLRFFKADPEHFDLVFTANATAGIKLVMEAFREQRNGFWYGYHVDAHTSLVGVREAAKEHRCFECDEEVDRWIDELPADNGEARLFAYPAQSNMNGRRLPLVWCRRLRHDPRSIGAYILLDAAAYASTSQLDLSDAEAAPDFTVLSLYKIFGFPDLGALIVRKGSEHVWSQREYFGGGTVDVVVSLKEQWHAPKSGSLHERLEDGTLPIHSIVALKSALQVHREVFGSAELISRHTTHLARELYDGLSVLRHGNGSPACRVYKHSRSSYCDIKTQGPIVALNFQDSRGNWVSNTEVEKLANIKDIHLRTGGVCNPGGVAQSLGLVPWEMRENFSAGYRCGGENDVMNGKSTGVVRVSPGAMSTQSDVVRFLDFVREFFVDANAGPSRVPSPMPLNDGQMRQFHVESLTVYPVKSCAGFTIADGTSWEIRKEGLAWDREWCIVHQGTGKALSQKQHPRMALIRPRLDFKAGLLRITTLGTAQQISVPLSTNATSFDSGDLSHRNASVCGDAIKARVYNSPAIADYLTEVLGVPCTLARFPAVTAQSPSARHSKPDLQRRGHSSDEIPRPILLSNESPILTISRSSLNRLNEQIKSRGGKAAHPSVFRANIVLAESPLLPPGQEQPWAEDHWRSIRLGGADGPVLEFLGGCRRCQMVCINQESGEKNQEPFLTLAKTRKFEGRVLFGVHTCLKGDRTTGAVCARITVGDVVETFT